MKSQLFLIAQIGFLALTLVYGYFFLKELRTGVDKLHWNAEKQKKAKSLIVIIPVLLALFTTVWSVSGFMSRFELFPINFAPVLFIPLAVVVYFTFSSDFTLVLKAIPVHRLIVLQSFRFFVEILLWVLFVDQMLPEQMTFEGRNFDILAGITGPVVAWLVMKEKISRPLIIIWNIICLGLLINIVTVAILSTPTPIRVFMEEPANTVVALFPISFLPGLLVPLAYTLHFFSLRQLLSAAPEARMGEA